VGVRGFGTTPEEASAGAARALISLVVAEDLGAMPGKVEQPIECEAAGLGGRGRHDARTARDAGLSLDSCA